jgi:hypothetical protein
VVYLRHGVLFFLLAINSFLLNGPVIRVRERREFIPTTIFSKTSGEELVKKDIFVMMYEAEYFLAVYESHLVSVSTAIVHIPLPKVFSIALLGKNKNAFPAAKGPVLTVDDCKEFI